MAIAVSTQTGACRCRECDLYLPLPDYDHQLCPICGDSLDTYTRSQPSQRWANRVWVATGRWPLGYPELTRSHTIHPPDTSCIVTRQWARYWVSERDLLELGYVPLPLLVVRLNRCYYELVGRRKSLWWVEEVDTQLEWDWPVTQRWAA